MVYHGNIYIRGGEYQRIYTENIMGNMIGNIVGISGVHHGNTWWEKKGISNICKNRSYLKINQWIQMEYQNRIWMGVFNNNPVLRGASQAYKIGISWEYQYQWGSNNVQFGPYNDSLEQSFKWGSSEVVPIKIQQTFCIQLYPHWNTMLVCQIPIVSSPLNMF